jgi:hypothetical protein
LRGGTSAVLAVSRALLRPEAGCCHDGGHTADLYSVLRKALLFTIVMQVRSLLDPAKSWGRDNVSLARFVGLFKLNYPELHKNLTTLLQGIVAHCQDIEKWGNRRVGHADLLTFLSHETLPAVSQEHF